MRNHRKQKRKDKKDKNPLNKDVHKIIQTKFSSEQTADNYFSRFILFQNTGSGILSNHSSTYLRKS